MASKSVDKRLAAQGENRDFATVLREWWSFDNHQRHTHSWHTREDFIDKELPQLLDDVRAQDANRYGYTHLAKPDDTHVRESLAGEGEAIGHDYEWLYSVGFKNEHGGICIGEMPGYLVFFCGDGEFEVYQDFDSHDAGSITFKCDSRRQLLSLLSALGIEVTTK